MSPIELPDDDRVMSFKQWYERVGLSKATAWRIVVRGEGPELIKLSTRRHGVTYAADRLWRAARTVSASTA
jgi:predicted DNA-binding transcriptional regulator AlpA